MYLIYVILLFFVFSCSQNHQVHNPISGLSKEDISISKNRAKQLNAIERQQIEDWIKQQEISFYSTALNYWVNQPDFEKRQRKENGQKISYQYEVLDFDKTKFYEQPKVQKEVILGKFKDLDAVIDAARYINDNEEIILLVPSVLAYGTYGDGDQIPHDMPLIIKLKLLK